MSDKQTERTEQDLWIVLARVEGEGSLFPEKRRMTQNTMVQMTNSYDPEFRKAPILAASDGFAAHDQTAHKFRPAVAYIEELDTDGLNLYGRIDAEHADEFAGTVAKGLHQRSVEFVHALPELDGSPPYLLRMAMFSGEYPGQPNLPDLSNYMDKRSLEDLEIETRTILDPIEEKPQEEADSMNEEMLAKLKELVTAAVAPLSTKLDEQGTTLDGLTTSVRDGEAAITKAAENAEAALKKATVMHDSSKEERVGVLLKEMVREERVAPFEVEAETKVLLGLEGEDYEERVAHLKTRPQMFGGNVGREMVIPGSDTPVRVPAEFMSIGPDGIKPAVNPVEMRTYLELDKDCKDDDEFVTRVLEMEN